MFVSVPFQYCPRVMLFATQQAVGALNKYSVDLVVANELTTRAQTVQLVANGPEATGEVWQRNFVPLCSFQVPSARLSFAQLLRSND